MSDWLADCLTNNVAVVGGAQICHRATFARWQRKIDYIRIKFTFGLQSEAGLIGILATGPLAHRESHLMRKGVTGCF